jgi:hypothetical protein
VVRAAAFLFASSAYATQNLPGLWTLHSKINDSESNVGCKLVVTDNKITGTCNFQNKDRQVTGTVDGGKVTLHWSRTIGDCGRDSSLSDDSFEPLYKGTSFGAGQPARGVDDPEVEWW